MLELEIVDTVQEIERKIVQAIAEEYNKVLNRALVSITDNIKKETRDFLIKTDFYHALSDGELVAHFGFAKGTGAERIQAIIGAIIENIYIKNGLIMPLGANFRGSLTIGVLRDDLSEIFALSPKILEVMNYSSKYPEGIPLPWAEWWLKRGDEIIISQHEISFVQNAPGSRSGQAIMIKNNAGSWRVPPEYSGTLQNNSLTRALLERSDVYINMLGNIIKQELERVM